MLDNATKLTHNFLINELGYVSNLRTEEEKVLFDDYYFKTCAYINQNHFVQPSIELIEQILDGRYFPEDRLHSVLCTIGDKDLRKRLFRQAMGKQLIYDLENGRTSMIKGDQTFCVCPEFKQTLSLLGFIQTGMYSRVGS